MPLLTLSIGSNQQPCTNIRTAVRSLRRRFPDLACSTVYESRAVGFEGENFLNLVACTDTDESLPSIQAFLKQLEVLSGRDHCQPRFSARPMDIDILTYGNLSGEHHGLTLPRDEILRHAFVLQPLAELLPEQAHPVTRTSYRTHWHEFGQGAQQPLWPVKFGNL